MDVEFCQMHFIPQVIGTCGSTGLYVNMIDYIDWLPNIESALPPGNKAHLVVEDFYVYVHEWYW